MNKSLDHYIELLDHHKLKLKEKSHVSEIGIFGSFVKNESRKDSDILVDFDKPIELSFFELKNYLETTLSRCVDLVFRKGIKAILRDDILKETIYI